MDLSDWNELDDAYLVAFGEHPDVDVETLTPFQLPPGPGRQLLIARDLSGHRPSG